MFKKLIVVGAAFCAVAWTSAQAQTYNPYGYGPRGGYDGDYGRPYTRPGAYGRQVGPRSWGSAQRGRRGPMAPQRAETEVIVESGLAKVRNFLATGGAKDKAGVLAFVEQELAPYFDFDHMTQWAMSRRWNAMNADQRQKATDWLSKHFLNALVSYLGIYDGARSEVRRPYSGVDGRTVTSTVPVSIRRRSGETVSVEFRFYEGSDGWKVYDVKAGGQSALMFYRKQLTSRSRPERRGPGAGRRMPPRGYGY